MSDVKKIDVTNAINSMNEAVAAFKEVGYAAINKNVSNEKIETLEIETKIEEEKDEGQIHRWRDAAILFCFQKRTSLLLPHKAIHKLH